MKPLLIAISLLLITLTNKAEVVSATDNYFHIKITAEVKATPSEAYAQYLKVGEWWSSDHTWFGDAKNMRIEAKAGGCFCETSEQGNVMHMQVSAVFPNSEVRMLGGLGPLQMMGLSGAMSWKFVAKDEQTTEIIHEYRVNGGGQTELPKFAEIVNKVQELQVSLLAKKLSK